MSIRSLGTLTLDMVLKLAGFTGPLDKAGRDAKKRTDAMKKDFAELGKVVAGLGAAAAGGLAYMTTSLASSAREIENLSRLAGASTDEFQKLTFGARRFGVEQEKVASILKDTQDKIGEFVATGGGPLIDFFEQIAPKVGVTADEFKRLSGPEALQLYVKSLEKAGASQQDFTFYMEALASDSTMLLPLLKDNGAALKALGEEADKTGNVLSKLDFENLRKVTESTDKLQAAFKGIGNEIVLSAIPAINTLTEILGDDQTVESAQSIGNAVVVSLTAATRVIEGAIQVTKFLAEELAAMVNGPDFGDLPRMSEAIEVAREEMKLLIDDYNRPRLMRMNPFISSEDLGLEVEKARKHLEKLQKSYEEAAGLQGQNRKPQNIAPTPTETVKVIADIGKPVSTGVIENKKNLEDTVYVYDDLLERIKEQMELQKKAADEMARINSQAADIADEFKTDEERLKESYVRRRKIVEENTQIIGDARTRLLIDLENKQALDLEALNAGYWERYLSATEENLQNFDKLTEGVINNFSSGFGNAFESIIFDSQNLGDAISNLAEGMARSVVNALGQMAAQWLAYQAVQILVGKTTQATAAAGMTSNALAAQQMAALNAFASTAAIPIVGPIAAPGAAVAAIAATTPFVAAITAFSAAGMAHEGIDSIPKTGTWLLEKGERVTTEKTSAKLDRTLSDIQKKQMGEGSISVINQTTGRVDKATKQRLNNGDMAIILQEVAGAFGDPNSNISRSVSGNYNVSRSR